MKSIALLAGTALALLLGAVLGHQSPAVELHNRSSEAVLAFSLSVAGEPFTEGRLPVGALDRHLVPVHREGPIQLELQFAEGRQARFDVGWFSPGQSNTARIAILSADSVAVSAW
jgi:hypothetical protein